MDDWKLRAQVVVKLKKERVEYTYGTPMSVLPSFAERKRVWVFRRCTLSARLPVHYLLWYFYRATQSARYLL